MEDTIIENVLTLYHLLLDKITELETKITEQQNIVKKLSEDISLLNKEIENIIVSAFLNRDLQGHRNFHEKRAKKWKLW